MANREEEATLTGVFTRLGLLIIICCRMYKNKTKMQYHIENRIYKPTTTTKNILLNDYYAL